MDAAFNPHNIFFVYDCDIDFIDNTTFFNSGANAYCNIGQTNFHTDGIDIYIAGDNSPGGGIAENIPSTFFVVGSTGLGSVFSRSYVIAHEMGHCLGLWHTHHGTITESGNDCNGNPIGGAQCPELVNGSNCDNCGDFVCDTPADPYIGFNVNASCQWLGSGTDSNGDAYAPDENAIMAYTTPSCMEYFTNGQGQRMRNIIEMSPVLQAVLVGQTVTCSSSEEDTHIYQNTTYNTDMGVNGNIYVHTGAQLTITSTVKFAKDKGVIVERGAKIHVNGGVLTKCPCAEDWRGINVEGNASKAQPNAFSMPAADDAGVVLINNLAHVEWARNAISTTRYNEGWNSAYWGGMVHCENATFLSNRRVAEFMKYDRPNQSKFVNCTMESGGVGYAGATIWDTDNVTFENCRFYNMTSQGILTYDAGAIVRDGSSFQKTRGESRERPLTLTSAS